MYTFLWKRDGWKKWLKWERNKGGKQEDYFMVKSINWVRYQANGIGSSISNDTKNFIEKTTNKLIKCGFYIHYIYVIRSNINTCLYIKIYYTWCCYLNAQKWNDNANKMYLNCKY